MKILDYYLSDETQEVIKKKLDEGTTIKRIAQQLSLPRDVIRIFDITYNYKYNMTIAGRGPKKMEKYIVAVKGLTDLWDNTDPKIIKARKLYDEGKVDMITGRDGFNLILYAIPRKVRLTTRKPYFKGIINNDNI